MRNPASLRGFAVGVLVGTLLGSTGLAAATIGFQGWTRFSEDFRNGYVNGFLDMANLARNVDTDGSVDRLYPYLPAVRPQEWRGVVDTIYKEPENQHFKITTLIHLAGKRLEDRYGKAEDPIERQKRRSLAQMESFRRRQAAKAGAGSAVAPPPQAAPPAEVKTLAEPEKPREKKWCRCDGTDPKAAREKRRAEAAAEASKSGSKAAAPAKTPPNAPPAAK